MKNWRKKVLGSGIAFFALCLLLCSGVSGAGVNELWFDFEDASYIAGQTPAMPGFSLNEKESDGGSIVIGQENAGGSSNQYLELSKTVLAAQSSNDVYIQTSTAYDVTLRTQISFKIRSTSANGNISIAFRDDNSNAGNGTVELLSFNNASGLITYGKEYAGSVKESFLPTEWTEIAIDMNILEDNIKIYRDGALKATLTGVKTNTEKLKNYNYTSCSLRFQEYGSGGAGAVTTYALDDIHFSLSDSFDSRFAISGKALYKTIDGNTRELDSLKTGSLTASAAVENLSQTNQSVRLAAAVYDNAGTMTGVFFSAPKTLASGENATLTAQFELDSLNEGDYVKLLLFEGNDSLAPLTHAKTYTQSEYTQPFAEEILHDLKEYSPNNAHPRLLMTQDKLAFLRTACKTQEPYRTWYASVKKDADKLLNSTSFPSYDDSDELRLQSAETAADRMMKLAFVYSIEGSEDYVEQLVKEIENCANWPDWNPKHFLDTAALIRGTALAYDWCYDYWQQPENAAQKETLVNALVNMGLVQAQKAFNGTATVDDWWTTTDNNWSFVCNGGVALGALALGDEEEYADLCGYVLEQGLRAIERSIVHFAPDGAWYEGPGYWHYTVRYMSMYFCALQTATGTDYGYLSSEGIDKTAHFAIGVTGQNNTVNLNDATEGTLTPPELFYLAAQFGDTTAAKYRYYQLQTQNRTPSIHDLLWYDPALIGDGSLEDMQLDFAFRDIELMTFRNEYFTDQVFFAALHGGKNGINHGHIDAGNFVYEANGVRWAIDLGGDNYNLPGYFNNSNVTNGRWIYYRNRGEGHNTIILNPNTDPSKPADQPLDTTATISSYTPGDNVGAGEIDMQPIYGQYTDSAVRSLRLDKLTGRCDITDTLEFKAGTTNDLYWFMHTKATIQIADDGRSAVLEQSGKKLYVYITQGEGTFEAVAAKPLESSPNPDGQNANGNIRKLQIHIPDASGSFNLQVTLSPVEL
ncbi:MAG TPA: heparinase II/III family protein [Candidatus Aphodoplasma excrementigallinarum]|uniref:Heparinase II/III family protein n=1 Tax=Candidatus Aphodoplasma excrementigallinarum TaxID=2840673 RepID=A0A9D1SZM7_9FIRM|nr:heparinase II/III family protein [Candidatus Aphodoplasma excrementigallinarum]